MAVTSDVLFPSMLAAVGLGLAFVPVTIAAVTNVKPDEAGLASGLINTSQQVEGRSVWPCSPRWPRGAPTT